MLFSILMHEKIKNALYAAIVGDALGVPVESSTRQQLALCSVKNMLGYGRWDQPEGTWSDDSSLTLCTMESLARAMISKTSDKHSANGFLMVLGRPPGSCLTRA